jgi:hypothetical protein
MRKPCKIFVMKPKGRRLLGRCRCRCKDNIRMDPGELAWEVVDWMHLSQDRDQWWALVNTIMSLQVP